MQNPKIRNRFTPPEPTPITDPGISLTQQHFKDETEINSVVRKYLKGHPLPITNKQPMFGDFGSMDFHEMKNAIADIDSQFASLPAKLRGRFRNDAYQLIRWIERPENNAEALRLGLLQKPGLTPDEQLDLVEAANTPQPPETAPKADPEAHPSFNKQASSEAGNAGKPA